MAVPLPDAAWTWTKRLAVFMTAVAMGLLYLSGMEAEREDRSLDRAAAIERNSTMEQEGNSVVSDADARSTHHAPNSTDAPSAASATGCGLIFFYHVNKVGGRTVQEHLKESTHEYLQLFPNTKDWSQALPEIESFLQFDGANGGGHQQWWKTLEIHHGFPGLLYLQENLTQWETAVKSQGCAFRKVTLLRNPIERLVSNMKWNSVPKNLVPTFANNMANWMSRHLAYNTCNSQLVCRWNKRSGISNSPSMSDERFLPLINVLDTFDVIGVMEDLQSFMDAVLGRPVSLVSTHRQSYADEPYPLTVDMYKDIVEQNLYDFRLYWRYAPTVLPVAQESGESMTLKKMRQYYTLNKPVLIKNATPFLFNNHKDFNSEFIRRNADPDMSIRASHYTGRLLNGDLVTTVPKCMDSPDRCVYFKKSHFSYGNTTDAIATDDTDPLRTNLLSGLNRSTFAWSGANSGTYCIYVSTHGGALPHSHSQRFNLLMEGQKRWLIVDPSAYANVSQIADFELHEETGLSHESKNREGKGEGLWATYKSQDWFHDVIAKGDVDIPHYDFVQEAGDLFFLPDQFTHGTIDLTPHAIGVIFKGTMTEVGTEGLDFPLSSFSTAVEHLPWRRTNTGGDAVAAQGHQFPGTPLHSIQTAESATKRPWQQVAGGAAKRFSNQKLDYMYFE